MAQSGDSILRNPSSSGSDGDQADSQHKRKASAATKSNRSVTFSLGANNSTPASPSASDASLSIKGSAAAAAALSARAKRSKRRQAKIEKDPTKIASAIKKDNGKKSIEGSIPKKLVKGKATKNSSTKKGLGGKEEEVVKVKLNTGTLYLYKGLHRRAVFVRRV